jgi:hypothetical protein
LSLGKGRFLAALEYSGELTGTLPALDWDATTTSFGKPERFVRADVASDTSVQGRGRVALFCTMTLTDKEGQIRQTDTISMTFEGISSSLPTRTDVASGRSNASTRNTSTAETQEITRFVTVLTMPIPALMPDTTKKTFVEAVNTRLLEELHLEIEHYRGTELKTETRRDARTDAKGTKPASKLKIKLVSGVFFEQLHHTQEEYTKTEVQPTEMHIPPELQETVSMPTTSMVARERRIYLQEVIRRLRISAENSIMQNLLRQKLGGEQFDDRPQQIVEMVSVAIERSEIR